VTGDGNQSVPRASTQTGEEVETEAGGAVTETRGYKKER